MIIFLKSIFQLFLDFCSSVAEVLPHAAAQHRDDVIWYDVIFLQPSWAGLSSWSSVRLKRHFCGPLQTLVSSSTCCAHKWQISPLKQYLRYSEQRSDMAALCYICFYDAIFCVYVESSAAEDSCGCRWRVIASRAQMKACGLSHVCSVSNICCPEWSTCTLQSSRTASSSRVPH